MTCESGESRIMQRVLVLDTNNVPQMPCHPARARKLLGAGKAAVYRRYPFTIILKYALGDAQRQPTALRLDPGSKITGISIVVQFARGWVLVWAANLHHRGQAIKAGLDRRRALRRSRRHRKTRYRKPRFDNRTRPAGWLAPSLRSRIDNVDHWAGKLMGLCPITSVSAETVRFDTQLMDNPEISGIQYQQGELAGYELREYLLEKWGRQCAYCDAQDVPLEVEHIQPRSKGGSDRASNLTLACVPCNEAKNNLPIEVFLKDDPPRLKRITAGCKTPLKDAAAINSIRWTIGDRLIAHGLPISFWSGGRTKMNRIRQDYAKDHHIDAACVGELGAEVTIPETLKPLEIKAAGRGSRQLCSMDRYGFQRTKPKQFKQTKGFQTGDMVKAVVPKGKKAGTHIGKVFIRASGRFRVGTTDGINWKYCQLIQRTDGYQYA